MNRLITFLLTSVLLLTHEYCVAGSLDFWTWRNPYPTGYGLTRIIYAAGQFVGVGPEGAIVTSADGTNWLNDEPRTIHNLNDIAYGNGMYIAVGGEVAQMSYTPTYWSSSAIETSPDGTSWKDISVCVTNAINAIAFGNGIFVAVASSFDTDNSGATYVYQGTIITSTDGLAWTQRFAATTPITAVAYGIEGFVALGDYGTVLSSRDGISWTQQNTVTNINSFATLSYGNGTYVAIGNYYVPNDDNGTCNYTILTSQDGTVWKPTASRSQNDYGGDAFGPMIYAENNFVIVGSGSDYDWMEQYTWYWTFVLTSPDGTNWTEEQDPGLHPWNGIDSIAYNNGLFVGATGSSIFTSYDAQSWTQQSCDVTAANWLNLTGVTFGGDQFVAVGSGSDSLGHQVGAFFTSPRGMNWTERASFTNMSSPFAVTYGNGQYIAIANSGIMYSSTNGFDWIVCRSNANVNYFAITCGNGSFVVVGDHYDIISDGSYVTTAFVLMSEDGVNWSEPYEQLATPGDGFLGVAAGNGIVVIVGGHYDPSTYARAGMLLTSSDGRSWTRAYCGTNYLSAITFADGQFVAVGGGANYGAIASSTDGLTWSEQLIDVSPYYKTPWYWFTFKSIAFSGGQFVAGGGDEDDIAPLFTSSDGVAWVAENTGMFLVSGIAYGCGNFVAVGGNGIVESGNLGCLNACPIIFTQPQNQYIEPGASGEFSVSADGMPPLKFQWQFNGQSVFGATNAVLLFNCIRETNDGDYSVIVRNGYGSVTSVVARLVTGVPIIATLPAMSVSTTTAQLNGSLSANSNSITACFEYGTTTAYGQSTISGNCGTNAQTISFILTGLAPNTTYHYRLDAGNSVGSSTGNDAMFTTSPLAASLQPAFVSGTGGVGLRLRSSPSLSGSVLTVMPDGSQVTLLGDTQTADGYLWRDVQYGRLTGWAADEYLVFGSVSLPPPPSAPTGLQQFQADGVTTISAGGTATGKSVVISATAVGSSSEQYIVQFEVRPLGTAFFAPTDESGLILGGAQASVSLTALLGQGYHWQARTMDGNGQTSPWVQFGDGSSSDFSVNARALVSALFDWSPPVPIPNSPVQFTAQASGGSGWSFQWDFGGGVTASGSPVNESFAQDGPVTVTLTVTDPQSHVATDTKTIQVASAELQNAINRLAQQTSAALDQISSQAQDAANAADEFQQSVDEAPGQIAISGAFTILSLGLDSAEYQDWLKSTTGQDAVEAAVSVMLQDATTTAYDKLFVNGQSSSAFFMPNVQAVIAQKKSDLEQQRQAAIAASATIPSQQAGQLVQNLNARLAGNLAILNDYSAKESLPVTFAALKDADESDWTMWLGEDVFDASVGVGLVAAAAAAPAVGLSGAVADMLSVSSSFGLGELDILDTLSQQSTDVQMFALSLDVLGQATISGRIMSDNVQNGLQEVINSQVETAPLGTISVQHFAQGGLSDYGVSPRWFTGSAYAIVTVRNTGTVPATYRVEASYPKTFTTTHLPIHGFGIGERDYPINVLSTGNPMQLDPNKVWVFMINYLTSNGGEIPSGEITYTLTSTTSDGDYFEGTTSGEFNTTLVDTNGVDVDHGTEPQVLLEDMPVASTLLQFGSSATCILDINVQNPLENPVLLDLQQPLPPGTTVIDPDGGIVSANQILWELNMEPGGVEALHVALILPTPLGQPPLSNTVAFAYDGIAANWVQFQATPSLIQVPQSPPSQIQPLGLTSQGFGLSLQTFAPGVYRIEATSDFMTWTPVSTNTNCQTAIILQDAGATTNACRFYRAVQIQ